MKTTNKSIKLNSIIYAIKLFVAVVSPMITFPYVCRILTQDAIGSVNFATSIISYFSLLSALGINSYAVRTGVRYREEREKFSNFASQMFSINLCSTIFSYLLFLVMLIFSTKWQEYTQIMLIVSLTIPMTTLGMEWVYTIYEEYTYITIRSIIVQIIGICFLFLAVKDESDVIYYAIYTVIVNVGSNTFNFFRIRKYCDIKIFLSNKFFEHLKPIFILFANAIASQIYLNSDITMLGYQTTDSQVALYTSAVKMYNLAKSVLAVFGTVASPRLAFYFGQNKKQEYRILFEKVINALLFFLIPVAVGVFILSEEIIVLISGTAYAAAGITLKILAITLIPSVMAGCIASCYLLVRGKEKKILYATTRGAIINVILNLFLIPKWGINGAAFATLIAEILVFILLALNFKKEYINRKRIISVLQYVLAVIPMAIICLEIKRVISSLVLKIGISMVVGVVVYVICLVVEKNEFLLSNLKEFGRKIKKEQ